MNRSSLTGHRRRRGFVLILVLAYLVLAASLLVTVTGSIAQLVHTTQSEQASMLLRQLTDSASAWAAQNRAAWTGAEVSLNGAGMVPPGASAVVTVSPTPESMAPGATIKVRAELIIRDRHHVRVVVVTFQ